MGTETTTVMFTDLVGSTALMSSVGEEAAEELRREHFSLLRASLGEAGREVKNLGDGIMAVFPSASDAVRAAVDVQRAAERRNRRAVHPLSIRIGVSLGEADVEDGDYFGPPVVEAARLCARAEGGEVLVADVVRLLAGTRGGFDLEPVGDLELKGLDAPVTTWRVAWTPEEAGPARPELPPRLVASTATHFVGREQEAQRLRAAWKEATAEARCRLVLLAGEPGIGKTTLSAQLATSAHAEGALVAYGRCDEDLGIPFQPWVEALTQVVAAAPEDVLRAHVADRGAHVARLVPDLLDRTGTEAPPATGGDDERFVLFGCVIDLLERASAERPVLLVLDDLHWADRASLQLLRQVVAAGRPLRATLLGTFRDSDVTTGDPLSDTLAALHREQGVERLALAGLSDADLLAWLEALAGHEMDEEGLALRDAVLAETAGNPFFVGEVLRHLSETGAIYQDDTGRWVGRMDLQEVGLPVSVREVIGRRLRGLGPDTERILGLAAVIGRDFDVGVVAAVAGADEYDVIDLCDAAVDAAVLQTTDRPDRYTFAHALIEHTLYGALSPARRARAHRAVAEAIEAASGTDVVGRAGELAHHWAAAVEPTDTAKALRYAEMAAAASAELAPEEALRWYAQALDLLARSPDEPEDPRRPVELLLGLGIAQRRSGDPAHRATLLDAARRADEVDAVDLQVQAVLANSRGFWSDIGGQDDDRVAAIERALERLGSQDDADRARLLSLLAVEQYFRTSLEHREGVVEEAVAIARRHGDPAVLAEVLYRCEVAVRSPRNLEQRAAWTVEAASLLEHTPMLGLRFNIFANRGIVALESGDAASIPPSRRACAELVERTPHAQWRWEHTYDTVVDALLDGELPRAEAMAEAALTLGSETGQDNAFTIYAGQVMNIRLHEGRMHELVELMEEVLAATPGLVAVAGGLALAWARGGEVDRARQLVDEGRDLFAEVPSDFGYTTTLACYGEAAVLCGHTAAVRSARDLLAPFHASLVTTAVVLQPPVAHYLGVFDTFLGDHDRAEAWFREAMEIAERFGSPLLVAYSRAGWARLLVDRAGPGDAERARPMASAALEAAERIGLGYVQADVRAVLGRLDG